MKKLILTFSFLVLLFATLHAAEVHRKKRQFYGK